MTEILNKINSPKDLKELSTKEMYDLADEMRDAIIKRANTISGHIGGDLGMIEATIALHYVFNSPVDKLIFDVSHQCYAHKMITGRKEGFTNPEKYSEISGYSNPTESEHDHFVIGHTSTSVSLATGLAKGRDLLGDKENIIALIGDGSLSGGEAFEGLNNAAVLNSNIIIVVNDNEMSIAENQGGLYKNLKLLRETNGQADCNFFKSMGFEYHYLEEGNDIEKLIETFSKVKDTQKPTVVHIHTLKGKGLKLAEENKEYFHWIAPNGIENFGKNFETETYESITTDYILKKKEQNNAVIAITAATPGAIGFTQEFRNKMGNNYTDVAISEEHAIAYISGLAKRGAKPIFSVISSFIQRTYDQLSQDIGLNNSPATILLNWGGISEADMTHLGCFDIPFISNIPNLVYLAPTNKEEYLAMLDWSVEQNEHPVIIRVPFNDVITTGIEDKTNYSILNKFKVAEQGENIAIIGVGTFFELAKKVKDKIKSDLDINATLINPCYLTGLDKELLENLKTSHKAVITLEDGILDGGFGQKIASFYGNSDMKVLNFGAEKEFTDRASIKDLYQKYNLTPEQIIAKVKNLI
ncbi:MAG: 1-deoxy-D-xylulose-5-phosphate synthase [bacterium]|nr:1-deoxy-D-xylulose-5-phosphate synthase [bacterium]